MNKHCLLLNKGRVGGKVVSIMVQPPIRDTPDTDKDEIDGCMEAFQYGVEISDEPMQNLTTYLQKTNVCPRPRFSRGFAERNPGLVGQFVHTLYDDPNSVLKSAVAHVVKVLNLREEGCNNPSERVGGTYQTLQLHSIMELAGCINKAGSVPISSSSLFLDIGCGQNRVCWIVAQALGCKAVGIEIDRQWFDIAAKSGMDLLKSTSTHLPFTLNTNVAVFWKDAEKPCDWTGFDVFFLWDTAFEGNVMPGMYDNIAYAMEEGKQYILVHSLRHRKRIKRLEEFVDIVEAGDKIDLSFFKGTSTSRVQIFKIEKKKGLNFYEGYENPSNLMVESLSFFENVTLSYKAIADLGTWDILRGGTSVRSGVATRRHIASREESVPPTDGPEDAVPSQAESVRPNATTSDRRRHTGIRDDPLAVYDDSVYLLWKEKIGAELPRTACAGIVARFELTTLSLWVNFPELSERQQKGDVWRFDFPEKWQFDFTATQAALPLYFATRSLGFYFWVPGETLSRAFGEFALLRTVFHLAYQLIHSVWFDPPTNLPKKPRESQIDQFKQYTRAVWTCCILHLPICQPGNRYAALAGEFQRCIQPILDDVPSEALPPFVSKLEGRWKENNYDSPSQL
jgi:hypothetical protein